jgi:CrcB protein
MRHLADLLTARYCGRWLPWGTLLVNVVGSLVLGVVVGAGPDAAVTAVVGTGWCGALTTYSTFSLETVQLVRTGRALSAAGYAVGSVLLGVGAAALGLRLGGS